MQSDGDGTLYELTREECLALLPTVPVGRLVFSERALPAVVPVNFVLDHGQVVVRTGEGSSLAAALRGEVVGFQVDDFDADARNGWSVLVIGRAAEVRDPTELARLSDLPLVPWAGGRRDHVLVVPVELVTGRRVGQGAVGGHAGRPTADDDTRTTAPADVERDRSGAAAGLRPHGDVAAREAGARGAGQGAGTRAAVAHGVATA